MSEGARQGALVGVRDLTRVYGQGHLAVKAVARVNLSLWVGEMVALMGPSGSGKLTLMQILGLQDRPRRVRFALKRRPPCGGAAWALCFKGSMCCRGFAPLLV